MYAPMGDPGGQTLEGSGPGHALDGPNLMTVVSKHNGVGTWQLPFFVMAKRVVAVVAMEWMYIVLLVEGEEEEEEEKEEEDEYE